MDWSKDKWEQACSRVSLCEFLTGFWPISPSGNPKSTCFYGPAGVRGAQSALFLRVAEIPEFRGHVFLRASGAPGAPNAVFSRPFLAPARPPGSGAARGRPGGHPFPDVRENAGPQGPKGTEVR